MKETISQAAFTKKVEIESANLQHYDRMSKKEADAAARKYIEGKFQVG